MAFNDQKAIPNSQISSFWTWFETIAAELGSDLENQNLLTELEKRVSLLGEVSWEVGPGLNEENALVITPDGVRERLRMTQHIVSLAPAIPGWEFHAARPPRRWELQFSIDSAGGGVIQIDARDWRYVLYEFPDHTFDIVLEQSNLQRSTESNRYTAAVVLLDGILGELKRLKLIGRIDTVLVLSEEKVAKANPIDVLGKHLDSLRPAR
jgi:hypothetical protein